MSAGQLCGKAQMNQASYNDPNTLISVFLASHGVHFYPVTRTVAIKAHLLLEFSEHDT